MRWALAAVAALAACAVPPSPASPERAPALARVVSAGRVDVAVRPPTRVVWTSSTLGPTKPLLRIVVTNDSATALDVSNLRVHLDATREGSPYRCAETAGPAPNAREPSSLPPRASFTFDRAIDCALPLTGSYAVRVGVSFGDGAWREPHAVQTFKLDVTPGGRDEPRPVALVPGMWAALGASRSLGGESGAGFGRIALLLVNGSSASIAPPPLRLVLSVHRAGTSIPCEDAPIVVQAPPALAAGASFHQTLEVSCLGLHATGNYEVVGRLMTDAGEAEVGRLRVEITRDPSLVTPTYPSGSWR